MGHPSKNGDVLMTDPLMEPSLKEEKADKISSMQWQLRAETPNLDCFFLGLHLGCPLMSLCDLEQVI